MLTNRVARAAARPCRQWLALSTTRHQPTWQIRFCSAHAKPSAEVKLTPDHRDLGVKYELFTTSPYSPGSPIFLPNGALIFNRLVDYLRKQYVKYGFQEVITPTIYKKALWAKSGHLENFGDDMYTVYGKSHKTGSEADQEVTAEEDEFALKPMNCPGHCIIYGSQKRSYRELPIRYADFSPLHRNEASGALTGLTRVRRFHQDDGHIFCRPEQIEVEILQSLRFLDEVYTTLGLGRYRLVLSTRPETHYLGTAQEWDQAESALRAALKAAGQPWTLNQGDGAFYGPKIDIHLRDKTGKEHQTATIQLDFQLPKRFELEYETSTSGNARPVMIHRAILGSVERLMALLIEQYNGKWPFWLNPRQVAILTVNDSGPVLEMAKNAARSLKGLDSNSDPEALGLTVDVDDSARTLSLKIREAYLKGYGVILIIGPRNVEENTVSVDWSNMPYHEGGNGNFDLGIVSEVLRTSVKLYR